MKQSILNQTGKPELGAEIRKTLDQTGYAALRDVNCQVGEREVTLAGEVPTHFMRQIAVAAVSRLAGARQIHNRIVVADPDRQSLNG